MLNERNKQVDKSARDTLSDGNLLFDAYHKAVKGSRWKASSQKYNMNVLENLSDLQKELEDGTYKTKKCSEFTISERGKTRAIHGNTLGDRIVRHVLCDYVLTPAVEPYLAYDNGASRKGKGVDFARNRFYKHLRQFTDKHGTNGYVLLIDFSKYYDNIRHDTVLGMIEPRVDNPYAMGILREIVDGMKVDVSYMNKVDYELCMTRKFDSVEYQKIPKSARTGKRFMRKSLSIGDQCSQVLSIYLPTPVDNYIHNVCGIGESGRYMDDSYVFCESKERLVEILNGVRVVCDRLGIFINEKKTQICRIDKPFHYLQNLYRVTARGKIVVKINKTRVTRERRRLKREAGKVREGVIDLETFTNSFRSWMGSFKAVMSRRQIENLYALFAQLLGGIHGNSHYCTC